MLELQIPGGKTFIIEHVVCDYNGTLACDGVLPTDLIPTIRSLASQVTFHVVTADTFGQAGNHLKGLPITLSILSQENQDQAKLDYIQTLNPARVAALGNGRNDQFMLERAALGICLVQKEGACVQTMLHADVVCNSAQDALALLLHPKRLVATLRC